MLKALELVGFKSFADRTRFEFPDGITVVVGPNGSGKSNVVDAVKWVLGAQSAKALRGADMADVIFKGSAEGGRKPANSAEVVLVLDNHTRVFSHDSDEVHVSRRVFRSGEGEYAINGQPCRLKDVKDLFRGTGVGVDAYSLIEQGKVDRLLQASAKDRRAIFEEAAGISRFKAKKVEAERRMVRVDQNMLRLKDIVDEVSKRLTTLKGQAAKASRYREMTLSLQSKRQQLGWLDRCSLLRDREKLESQRDAAKIAELELQEKVVTLQELAAKEQSTWQQLQMIQESIQAEFLEAQRTLIESETGAQSSQQRSAELAAEQAVLQDRIGLLQQRATLSSEEIQQKCSELLAIEEERNESLAQLKEREAALEASQSRLVKLKAQLDLAREQHAETREQIATQKSQIQAYKLHIEQLNQSIAQYESTLSQSIQEKSEVDLQLQEATRSFEQACSEAIAANANKQFAEHQLQRSRLELLSQQEQLIAMQGKLHGVRERLHVLTQLEEQYVGAGRGGQQLLRLARENQSTRESQSRSIPDMPLAGVVIGNVWDTVLGVVADKLTTEMHLAPLIDVALGTHADAIVLSNGQIIDWINEGNYAIDGRVTLLRMDRLISRRSGDKIQLDGLRGVLGRADRMTRFEHEYEPLVRFLLGTTWFVDTLTTALELSHFRGAGLRFVTAECQLVESDGSITLGSLQTGLGLVSRRSEMQSAREEIKLVEDAVAEGVQRLANTQAEVVLAETMLRTCEIEAHDATRQKTSYELRRDSLRERQEKLAASLSGHLQNVETARSRLIENETRIDESTICIEELLRHASEQEASAQCLSQEFGSCESEAQSQQVQVTEHRIQMARIEQQALGLRVTVEQMQQDSEERLRGVSQAEEALASIAIRIASAALATSEFQAKSETAKGAISAVEARRAEAARELQSQSTRLQDANRDCESARRSSEKSRDRIEAVEQQLAQLESQWNTLHSYYAQEFQVDLNQIAEETNAFLSKNENADTHGEITIVHSELLAGQSSLSWFAELVERTGGIHPALRIDRSSIEAEIAHLRQEIAASGGVNMEALSELDELQARHDKLSNHYSDLSEAKSSLVRTMTKIDEDSRELFMTTLQTIRKNFQDLYRRSFGGGFADIVMEDESDPESGIEIIATPPGKTTLSNTLLSGGEKALTAVALIMAFFQYRPSPFCILDEVDAPFDEANIGRFVTVLREFLDTTKFIVVTHSKKTMTAANMIYGVTMQESGVSRQVSVRFEEVGDKGEILPSRKAA